MRATQISLLDQLRYNALSRDEINNMSSHKLTLYKSLLWEDLVHWSTEKLVLTNKGKYILKENGR